ncbi:DUF2066 domain-containing protein [Marinobacter sp.]|uniref:DUF2066 domain-containing protein n=1 Tax=Marinobacter sp. TaxID=50741 RepID=UPI0034A0DC93
MSLSGRISTQAARAFRQTLLITGSLAALIAAPAGAVTVSGLYSIEVPVEGSQPGELKQGYADGLEKVFVRVSGSREVLDNAGVAERLDDAESLLQSYQFLRSDDGDRLRMTFGAVGVNSALASVDAPVWGANRPLTLAWVAVEERGTRTLLTVQDSDDESSGGGDSRWSKAFQQAASDRGLPVSLPPRDMAGDRELLSDIWGQFTARVKSSSEEIGHDAMALVRVSRSGGEWRAGWIFDGMGMDEGEQSVTAGTEQALAEKVIGRWADAYASRYAVAAGDVDELPKVDIVISGVSNLKDYGSIIDVLDDLTPVQDVGASRVAGDQLTLRVAFSGELEQLREYIALDARLVPLSDAEESNRSEEEIPADTTAETDPSGSVSDPLFVYQPLLGGAEESEEAFESLYEILRYRWQPASVIGSDVAE